MSYLARCEPGEPGRPTLLLLHGTGGDEHNLIGLGQTLAPGWPLLSPRGTVDEDGALRFFRRFAEGQLDIEDMVAKAHEMAAWLPTALPENDAGVIAVGYSNGANMAVALLLLHPELFRGALLLRPMNPLRPDPLPDLSEHRVQIHASPADMITPSHEAEALHELLKEAGAEATYVSLPGGHGLTGADIEAGRQWLAGFLVGTET